MHPESLAIVRNLPQTVSALGRTLAEAWEAAGFPTDDSRALRACVRKVASRIDSDHQSTLRHLGMINADLEATKSEWTEFQPFMAFIAHAQGLMARPARTHKDAMAKRQYAQQVEKELGWVWWNSDLQRTRFIAKAGRELIQYQAA